MKKQVLVIHGGDVFDSYEEYLNFLKEYPADLERLLPRKKWKNNLQDDLGEEWEVLSPQMPNYHNAKYSEWKVWFEKILPHLRDEIVLVGHSLGGTFLAKYLAENNFPVKVYTVYLVAAPFDEKDRDVDYTLGDFALPESLQKFQEQTNKIFLYYSKDDPTVPISDLEKYTQVLPKAEKVIFTNYGHFHQEHFPEIVEAIKNQ
ncbi:MAG: alpha/beta hydrolase [Leadbetterella sp.]|nr:alpha/beta hydrolase [Leadbetterella sp.]